MSKPDKHSLRNFSVLVTRPDQQSQGLCQAIEALGGRSIQFPVLEIKPAHDTEALSQMLDNLSDYDIGIFISANAVNYTLIHNISLPAAMKVAAIGKATTQALEKHSVAVDICPDHDFSSEALLQMPAMNKVAGKSVVIFRGNGGREALADSLRARGAEVSYIEVYRRELPQVDATGLLAEWKENGIDAIVTTSLQGLENLQTLLGEQGRLYCQKTAMVVMSERMLKMTEEIGIKADVLVATEACDEAIVAALIKLHR